MQILVLGMHRSGTSALGRVLNMMGAYFGSEGAGTGANKENPKGFWERRDVRELNDFVLNSLGCDWNRTSQLDLARLKPEVLSEFQKRSANILFHMDGHRPWFMKEPRLCLLLELWKPQLEVPVCVHIHRNPVEVARSLFTRNQIPTAHGIALWEQYNAAAFHASMDLPRLLVSHHDLMLNPVAETRRVFERLVALGVEELRLPSEKEINAFISSELYRERFSDEDLPHFLTKPQLKFYEALRSGRILKRKKPHKISRASSEALVHFDRLHSVFQGKIDTVSKASAQIGEKVERQSEARLKELTESLAEKESQRKSMKAELEQVRQSLRSVETNAERARQSAAAEEGRLRGEVAELKKRLSQAAERDAAAQEERVELDRCLEAAQEEIQKRLATEQAQRIKLEQLGGELEKSQRELREAVETANRSRATAVMNEARLRQEAGVLERKLAESEGVRMQAQERLEQFKYDFQERMAESRLRLAEADAALQFQGRELTQTREELAAAMAEVRRLEGVISSTRQTLGQEVQSLERQLADSRDLATRSQEQVLQLTEQLRRESEHLVRSEQRAAAMERRLEQLRTSYEERARQTREEYQHALDAASLVRSELEMSVEQQRIQLSLVKKGLIGIDQYINQQADFLNQVLAQVENVIHSPIWKFSRFICALRDKVFFRQPTNGLETGMKTLERNREELVSSRKPTQFPLLEVVDADVVPALRSEAGDSVGLDYQDGQDGVGSTARRSLDIVVCVHNAPEDVRNCLESIRRCTETPYSLYLVDDGSGKETRDYLRQFDRGNPRTVLIRHSTAIGYTRSANVGLRHSTADYVVVLNSDTVVTPGWDRNLIRCGESDPNIGIIGPLSNAASWQSVPERFGAEGDWMVNAVPEGLNLEELGRLVHEISKREYPEVQLINGFCFVIKRAVLEHVGLFDEAAFPRGYGEENDFCLRAVKAGFTLVIADDTYVFHAKSKSFTHEGRRQLAKQGGQKLRELHGKETIERAVATLRESSTLAYMREALTFALRFQERARVDAFQLSTLRVLFLLPVSGGGGGVHSVLQETMGMRELGTYAKIAVPAKHKVKFQSAYPGCWQEAFFFFESEDHLTAHASHFTTVVATIFTSVKLLEKICRAHSHLAPAYYIQDYEPWIVEPGTDYHKEATASYTRVPSMRCFAKTEWLCGIVEEKHQVPVHKVKPSIDHGVYFPGHADRRSSSKRMVVSAMIRPKTPRRAAPLTMRVLAALKRQNPDNIEVVIFGCDPGDKFFKESDFDFEFTNHGPINREAVGDVLRGSDLFLDLSVYQAFGRTGLEAMACGAVPVLPKKGGVYEYAVNNFNSLIVDTSDASEPAIVKAIAELMGDRANLATLMMNALDTAKHFTVEKSARSEVEFFEKCLADHSQEMELLA